MKRNKDALQHHAYCIHHRSEDPRRLPPSRLFFRSRFCSARRPAKDSGRDPAGHEHPNNTLRIAQMCGSHPRSYLSCTWMTASVEVDLFSGVVNSRDSFGYLSSRVPISIKRGTMIPLREFQVVNPHNIIKFDHAPMISDALMITDTSTTPAAAAILAFSATLNVHPPPPSYKLDIPAVWGAHWERETLVRYLLDR